MVHRVLESEGGNTIRQPKQEPVFRVEYLTTDRIFGRLEFENRHFQCVCSLIVYINTCCKYYRFPIVPGILFLVIEFMSDFGLSVT